MKGQSHIGSFAEAVSNIIVGVGLNFIVNIFVFRYYGWTLSLKQNFELNLLYTSVSLGRSFLLRRLFNKFTYEAR